jgi:hypothetical protein
MATGMYPLPLLFATTYLADDADYQRLREEQPCTLQRSLRVRDHLRVPGASAEGSRMEAYLRRLCHIVSDPFYLLGLV